jgi:hypothetical protein
MLSKAIGLCHLTCHLVPGALGTILGTPGFSSHEAPLDLGGHVPRHAIGPRGASSGHCPNGV